MNVLGVSNILSLLGGVALFLFGMSIMGDGLKKVAGNKLELVLYKLTSNPVKGVLLGLLVTAVIQSSSATSVMVVGFVNSGMMQVSQAIGIIMGANIGTSVTGWILCLSNISGENSMISLFSTATLTAVIALVGIVLRMLTKSNVKKHLGDILLGFAVLMYGMQSMSAAVSPLSQSEAFISILTMFQNPFLGILMGILITAVLQSASASVGILQALSMTGAVNFATALPIVMGMGIGASVPVLLSAIGANVHGKRTALIYLINDLFGTVIWSIIFYTVNSIVHFDFIYNTVGPVEIAFINTLFRAASILVLLPFIKSLERLVCRLVKDKNGDDSYNDFNKLDDRFIAHPALAIEQSRIVLKSMASKANENLSVAIDMLKNYNDSSMKIVEELESVVDRYEDKLGTYLVKITGRELSSRQNKDVSEFLHTIGDFERISDHALNVAEAGREIHEKNILFSDPAVHELDVLGEAVREVVKTATESFINRDLDMAYRVEPLEEIIDNLCDEMKLHHVDRIQKGLCTLSQGFVFNDLLTNYERVADHCSNIAVAFIELESDSFDTHEYLNSLKDMKSDGFARFYDEYKAKYTI